MTGVPSDPRVDLPVLKLTPSVDQVVAVLAGAHRRKLSNPEIVRASGVSAATVAKALVALKASGLAQAVDQARVPDRPVHMVWWLTGAGEALAARRAQPDAPAAPPTP